MAEEKKVLWRDRKRRGKTRRRSPLKNAFLLCHSQFKCSQSPEKVAPIKIIWPGPAPCRFNFPTIPTTNGGMQNGSSVGIHTQCIHVFARLTPNLSARPVLINKISASELSRKFIKSALSVWQDFSLQSPVEEIASINLAMLELKSTCGLACSLAYFRPGCFPGQQHLAALDAQKFTTYLKKITVYLSHLRIQMVFN